MRVVTLASEDDFEGWRDAARGLAQAGVLASEILWQVGETPVDLFADEAVLPPAAPRPLKVPRAFLDLAQSAILHSDPERFALLYALLAGDPHRVADAADPLVRRLEGMAREVRRDIHKMRAFVRFREVEDAQPFPGTGEPNTRYVAWFEPIHHIVRANARFFVERFTSMRWSILTPELSLHWDTETLSEGPGATAADAPGEDPVEDIWKTYYASIFNPARLKTGAMLKEMPRKYWKNMPETALVKELVATARQRETAMVATQPRPGGNVERAWAALREEAAHCTRCDLYRHATQTVFGEGPADARMMIVGEQPGDQEDLAGHPFVGPAGEVFDRAMAQAGIDRASVYVTNAVKHFKFEPRGKRRIHSKPDAGEIQACRWWYEQERLLVKPELTIALGATAARQMLGKTVTIGAVRGRALDLPDGGRGWVTVHPSYLLRLPDRAKAEDEFAAFVEDLKGAAKALA
ncbi:UdgX family uracil-DNA binding protein [Sphingomonas sp. NIBR02145]|uniref:UdgX family uracil-DNA binding protein n=1 Tax=Sphingomonas sp. NIBR02145 TaxID=3014784 RepID=UPI0022B33749|nr:UdgX family uracil-DNA binding protein [Sphingomonas sp. NIBR02145]WHU01440.1 UdgX family uracil-DNA binding protein [Sphingomonas sp. NIBR02145]